MSFAVRRTIQKPHGYLYFLHGMYRQVDEETRRAEAEANRAEQAEKQLAEALAELERLRSKAH